MSAPLDSAFDDFLDAIGESIAFLREHPFYEDAENRASANAFLTSLMVARIEENLVWDAAFPFFRVIDPRSREGADNADQRYLVSRVIGGATYRIWGSLEARGGSSSRSTPATRTSPAVEDARPPRSPSRISTSARTVPSRSCSRPNGCPGTGWRTPTTGRRSSFVEIYSDWNLDPPGEVHIDRVGSEGALSPPVTEDVMARRLRHTAADLRSHVRVWPQVVQHFLEELAPNELGAPQDSGPSGGVPGRWMVHGTFELDDDEALIVKTAPATGNYQGIQLLDLWLEALEYANRQTSLTGDQTHLSDDGCYRYIVSSRDPGVANWLDTVGRRRGVMLLRYDGTTEGALDPRVHPTATKVKLADLAAHLPAGTVAVSPEERQREIAARRKHVQIRFGN